VWGPYVPKPGHPTQGEKRQFIETISGYAKEAEANTGVPASVIAAMAIKESGFGFTRLALNAHNLFGYRFPVHAPAGTQSYTLHNCFAESGPDKTYARFSSDVEGIEFVAMRLKTLPRYSPITKRYAAIPFADRTMTDIHLWLSGIAKAGYAANADEYVLSLTRIMNNPEKPSGNVSSNNLYELSLPHLAPN
jgi:uncharacterized FlgJ-related protein